MKDITLQEFEAKYFPKVSKNYIAEMLGISISIRSKIYYGEYSTTAPEFLKVKEFIKENYSLNLIRNRREEELKRKYEKIIEKKDSKIIELQTELAQYKEEIKKYKQIQKCVDYLARNGERIR